MVGCVYSVEDGVAFAVQQVFASSIKHDGTMAKVRGDQDITVEAASADGCIQIEGTCLHSKHRNTKDDNFPTQHAIDCKPHPIQESGESISMRKDRIILRKELALIGREGYGAPIIWVPTASGASEPPKAIFQG